MNRRAVLKSLGAVGIGLAAAGLWRAESNHVFSMGEGAPYAAWQDWKQAGVNPAEQHVRAAVLAANPHNTQPWKFDLLPDGVDVYADTSRQIGMIDPLLREMHIGVGCAIENLLLSAEAAGYAWSFDQPASAAEKALQPVVRIVLKKDSTKQASNLYPAIPQRHTNRGPYWKDKNVGADIIESLSAVNNSDWDARVFWFQTPKEKKAFADLIVAATEAIIADPEQSQSSARWIRTSWSDVQRFRDGLTYDTQGMSPVMRSLAKFMPPIGVRKTDQFWLAATRGNHVATASAFGMIAVRDANNLQQRVEAGRLWQRMHLLGTLHGVAMQPLSQPVERRDREIQLGQASGYAKALADLQQDDGWQSVLPFRLGYPTQEAPPSPRRELASVLI